MDFLKRKKIRNQLDQRLKELKEFALFEVPVQGWIKSLRQALGMSSTQLAAKARIDQSRISRLEASEKSGDLKMSSLKKIAQAMDMQFVYGFVPKDSLEGMVHRQATKIARQQMKILNDTMQLEQQGLSKEQQQSALNDMVERILVDQPNDFWSV